VGSRQQESSGAIHLNIDGNDTKIHRCMSRNDLGEKEREDLKSKQQEE